MAKVYYPVQLPLFTDFNNCVGRRCTICHEVKPLADFYSNGTVKFGQCKSCYIARQHDTGYHREIRPDACVICGEDDPTKFYYRSKGRKGNRCKLCRNKSKTRFGLTYADRMAMLQDQGGGCAICGNLETVKHQGGTPKNLSVDHDHKTGKVRGLLCHNCNVVLGSAHDDPKILRKAIAYLRKHKF